MAREEVKMKPINKPKVTVLVSHLIEVKDGPPQPNRLTSAEAKRYASSRPLRRYKPRRKA